jgi:hypothetical protein
MHKWLKKTGDFLTGFSRRPSLRQVESSRLVFAAPIASPGPTGPAESSATAVCSSGNGSFAVA